jgi:hypothetical protein
MKWGRLVLGLTLMLIAGCERLEGLAQMPPDPFAARTASEDGAIVSWGGDSAGYEPGVESVFDLRIQNETNQVWRGRYCLQLLAGQAEYVIATLAQNPFTLEPGMSLSETLQVRFPEGLAADVYGLALVVQRPGGPLVGLTPIQVGATDEMRQTTTQRDMDAALAACPPVGAEWGDVLVESAVTDLAQRLNISREAITVRSVVATDFPDASLGAPQPGEVYAQVITPGHIIDLVAAGQTYRYHAGDGRIVAVPEVQPVSSDDYIRIHRVELWPNQVIVRGDSNLPDRTCINVELWADGILQLWWPVDVCAPVELGNWQLAVAVAPETVVFQPNVQYVVRAYRLAGPDIAATLNFNIDASAP